MPSTNEDELEMRQEQFEETIAKATLRFLRKLAAKLSLDLGDEGRRTRVMALLRSHIFAEWGEDVAQHLEYMGNHVNPAMQAVMEDEDRDDSAARGGTSSFSQQQPTPRNEGADELMALLKTLNQTNVNNRPSLRLVGTIGDQKDAKNITYSNLLSQVADARASKFTEEEIVRAIKKATVASSHLRTVFDTTTKLALGKMLGMLRDFYHEKSARELNAELEQLAQAPTEKSTDFTLRAMQLRQRAIQAYEAEGGALAVVQPQVQGTFVRSLQTGLREDATSSKLDPLLCQAKVDDGDLLRAMNVADLMQEDRVTKKKRDRKVTVAQVETTPSGDLSTLLKPLADSIAQLQQQMKEMKTAGVEPQGQRGAEARDSRSYDGATTRDSRSYDGAATRDSRSYDGAATRDPRSYDGAAARNSRSYDGPPQYNATRRPGYQPKDFRCRQCKANDEPRCYHCFKCGSLDHRASYCHATPKN